MQPNMHPAQHARTVHLPIHDPATRLFLLTRLIQTFDTGDQAVLDELLRCGFTPELIDKLRGLSLVDALRFVAEHCGLSVGVHADAVAQRMRQLDRLRADRQLYEYFIHAGASPATISRLFHVPSGDVRRLRRLVAPHVACGGRPRVPAEPLREEIASTWARITADESSERQALWMLHQRFPQESMATLETVIRPTAPGTALWQQPACTEQAAAVRL